MGTEISRVLLGALLGIPLGLAFFGGLWWTVNRLPKARRPHLFWSASLALRLALALSCLLVLARWERTAFFAALATFFLARVSLTRRLRPMPWK